MRHLHLGKTTTDATSLNRISNEVKALLATIAPQLVTLGAVFDFSLWGARTYAPSNFLSSTLTASRDIESLSLGIIGFSFSTILPLLQPLLHLRTLVIGQSMLAATQGPFGQLTSTMAVDFINGAVALKALTLPRQLNQAWTKDGLIRVTAAAEEKGVRFRLE
jgi:hypothetical protein